MYECNLLTLLYIVIILFSLRLRAEKQHNI